MLRKTIFFFALLFALTGCALFEDKGPELPKKSITNATVRFALFADSASAIARWFQADTSLWAIWQTSGGVDSLTWAFGDTTPEDTAAFSVPRGNDPLSGNFCIKSLRPIDGAVSADLCAGFVIPGLTGPPAPDSLVIEVAWETSTQVIDGQRTVLGIYLDHLPVVDKWVTSEWSGTA